MAKENSPVQQTPLIQPIIETYRAGIETLVSYMRRTVQLLQSLYADQDEMIDQLREIFAKGHSLRHADFDAIMGKVLADRQKTRQCLSSLVEQYRVKQEAVIREVGEVFSSDMPQAIKAWPALKERLIGEQSEAEGEIVTALRQVHMEQEELSSALSSLLTRGERLKISDLKTVARKLSSRDSRDSAELASVLAMCEAAGRDAGLKWQRLAV